MTGQQFLNDTLVLAGINGQGETPSPEDTASALNLFNNMLDRWNTERLNIYTVSQAQYALAAGVGSYLIGPSGTAPFVTARPTMIQNANIVYGGLRFPLDLPNSTQWAAIVEQSNVAIMPNKLYCDYDFPNARIYLNPVPTCISATFLELFTWKILAAITDLTLDIAFPTGYLEPLQYNWAVRICPAFGVPLDPTIIQIAVDSKASLRQLNAQMLNGPMGEATRGLVPANGLPVPQQ